MSSNQLMNQQCSVYNLKLSLIILGLLENSTLVEQWSVIRFLVAEYDLECLKRMMKVVRIVENYTNRYNSLKVLENQ